MTSISDGSLPEDQAKVFARQYAKEIQEEKDEATKKIVDERNYKPGDNALRGLVVQDLNSKIQSGQIKIV